MIELISTDYEIIECMDGVLIIDNCMGGIIEL